MILGFIKSSYQAIKSALKKARNHLQERLVSLFSKPIDENLLEELEEILYEADFGVALAQELTQKMRSFLRKNDSVSAAQALAFLEQEITMQTIKLDTSLKQAPPGEPSVYLIVGTNGSGKTTFIAKLANKLQNEGHKVLLAACDTFRAGAQEQLSTWAMRTNCTMVSGNYNGDPAAVAFEAIQKAKAEGFSFVLIDTAGRLENKTHLMKELEKIRKNIARHLPQAPTETLLVLDATIGQNAIAFAKTFKEFTPLTGLVLTKIDGTAKGGMAIAIQKEINLPIKFLSTGEKIDEISTFDAHVFAHSLFFE